MKKLICSLFAFALVVSSCGEKIDDPANDKTDDNTKETFASFIFRQGNDGYPIFRIPATVTTKAGTLLCFCEARAALDDNGNIDIVVKRSEDLGKTWGDLILIADAETDRYGNPVPVVLDDGRIMIVFGWSVASSSMSTKVFYCISEDDGKTWSAPTEITDQIKVKGMTVYQTGPVHGIVKQLEPHKGRIIVPTYEKPNTTNPCAVIYSDDNGATWHHGGNVSYGIGGEPTVAERGDGTMIINMRDNDKTEPYRYQAVSEDGGETWGPARATPLIEPNGCQGALLTYKMGTAAGNTIILFSDPNNTSSRRHGSVKMSEDGGTCWNVMFQYATDSGDSMYTAYSDLLLVKDDIIGVAFEAGYKYAQGIRFRSFRFKEIKELYTGQDKS